MSRAIEQSASYADPGLNQPSRDFDEAHQYEDSRWLFASFEVEEEVSYVDPYGAGGGGGYDRKTMNKAWHVPTTQWVNWKTDAPDPTGASYPGPGLFGECTNYRAEFLLCQQVP